MKNSGKVILSLCILFLCIYLTPGEVNASKEYAVSRIPAELLADANSVYRVNNMEVTIDGTGTYTVKREIAVTILNENGTDSEVLVIPYDSFIRPRFSEGAIYDGDGNEISKIRRRDLVDMSNFDSSSLFADNRIMAYQPAFANYPYTVVYKYEVNYRRGLFHIESFYPTGSYNTSTEKAMLRIDYPATQDIMYHAPRVEEEKIGPLDISGNRRRIVWLFENLPAVRHEHLVPGFGSVAPGVLFATDRFEFDGYGGRGTSWKEFGKWVGQMTFGRDQLPPERISQLQDMVKDIESDREKVKVIYEFLQSRTRYMNISLGIGGLQPFDALTVDRTGYGDCKALTNYMMAMLKAVDIESNYTLVMAGPGRHQIHEPFAVSQFNHVILCVPLHGDTIWLECTSQITPFGYLGSHTDNRPVLILKEDGGHLARTYGYTPQENKYNTSAVVEIDRQGNGSAKITMDRGGIFYEDYFRPLRMSSEEQQRWIYNTYSFPNFTVSSHSFESRLEESPVAVIEMEMNLRSFADASGSRLFVPVFSLLPDRSTPPRVRNRQHPFRINFPRVYSDTIHLNLPQGYRIESAIPDLDLTSDFGTYSTKLTVEGNEAVFVRKMEIYSGRYDAEQYESYFRFFQGISRAESQRIVFVRD